MTTIAYRDGIMAADTATWDCNGVYFTRATKIIRLNNGRILGGAGSRSMLIRVACWADGNGDKPSPDDDVSVDRFMGIVAENDKFFYIDSSLVEMRQYGSFIAIGSGRELALGAMAMGASAEDAVTVAIQFDCKSRGPVDIMKV